MKPDEPDEDAARRLIDSVGVKIERGTAKWNGKWCPVDIIWRRPDLPAPVIFRDLSSEGPTRFGEIVVVENNAADAKEDTSDG